MKLIIAGTRTLNVPKEDIRDLLEYYQLKPMLIISGGAKGVDEAGEIYAKWVGIPVRCFNADWVGFGKAAGPIRNELMAEYGDALLLIWDGKSPGSRNMKFCAQQKGIPIYEAILK